MAGINDCATSKNLLCHFMGETAPLYSIIQWLTSRVMEAEFQLSEYRMPGLDGMELWRQHAENTARVLKLIQEGLSVGE